MHAVEGDFGGERHGHREDAVMRSIVLKHQCAAGRRDGAVVVEGWTYEITQAGRLLEGAAYIVVKDRGAERVRCNRAIALQIKEPAVVEWACDPETERTSLIDYCTVVVEGAVCKERVAV